MQIIRALVSLLACLACSAVLADTPPSSPSPPALLPTPPAVTAKSYILMDADSGRILAEKNPDLRLPPASLTKLMTMYVISDALKQGTIHPEERVRISEKAWRTSGSRMFVQLNSEVPVHELLKGIVVASGNDAAVAMAEHIAGTENAFASLMNTQAKRLAMQNSHFTDSNGLPNAEHYSTAHDIALLSQAIIRDFPDEYRLYAEKWFSWNNIRQPNRNRLLWHFPAADGLKTGHTTAAGFCLAGSAKRNTTRLISVVMGEPGDNARTEDSIRLLTWGFRFFETRRLYEANVPMGVVRVWKGAEKTISLGLEHPVWLTLPAGQFSRVKASLIFAQPLHAPLQKNQPGGTLKIMLDGETLTERPLVTLQAVPAGGIFRQMADTVRYHLNQLFQSHAEGAQRA